MSEIRSHGHSYQDWCHICGKRSFGLADVWYSDNAEHGKPPWKNYVRICDKCAKKIADACEPECIKERNG